MVDVFQHETDELYQERTEWCDRNRPTPGFAGGDNGTRRLLQEQEFAYCHGLDLTTIILGGAIIEQVLDSELHYLCCLDPDYESLDVADFLTECERHTLGELLSEFEKRGYDGYLDGIKNDIETVKRYREQVYHYRPVRGDDSLTFSNSHQYQQGVRKITPDDYQDEVKFVMNTVFQLQELDWSERRRNASPGIRETLNKPPEFFAEKLNNEGDRG